jgi:hypothetical protein
MTDSIASDVMVRLTVSQGVTAPAFSGPPTTRVLITTGCDVEAQLTGSAFTISPPNWQEQSFLQDPNPYLDWSWSVTPTQVGSGLELHVEIASLYHVAGSAVAQQFLDKTQAITVEATPESTGTKVSRFLENPLFLTILGAILVVILGIVVERRFGRKNDGEPKREPQEVTSPPPSKKAGPGQETSTPPPHERESAVVPPVSTPEASTSPQLTPGSAPLDSE